MQRYVRRKCGFLLRDLVAAANLPPHGALFSQQLLDLTHRWWTEREQIPTLTSTMSTPFAAAVYIHIKLHSERYPGPAPFQLPDPLQAARFLTDLLTDVAVLLARRQPHNAPLLHSAWTVQQIIAEECRILESVHHELGTPAPAAWIQVLEKRLSCGASSASSVFRSLRARSSRASPLVCWRVAHGALPTSTSQIGHSQWSPGPVARGAPRNSSRARSGLVSGLPEHARDKAAVARFGSSGACLLTYLPILCFVLSSPSVAKLALFLIRLRLRDLMTQNTLSTTEEPDPNTRNNTTSPATTSPRLQQQHHDQERWLFDLTTPSTRSSICPMCCNDEFPCFRRCRRWWISDMSSSLTESWMFRLW